MSRKCQRDDKVIHVVFGPGGGRLQRSSTMGVAEASGGDDAEPVAGLFTRGEVCRLLGVTVSRLRTLDASGIVVPSGRRRGRRAYTFTDLIALRAAHALLSHRVRLRDVTRAVETLRRKLPHVERPLVELRVSSDGHRVVVESADGPYEPLSGQMLLDFDVRTLRDEVVRVLRPSAGRQRAKLAYELYLQASQLDEDPGTMAEAESLYRRAIELDPWLAIAYTNLGNIFFRRHDIDAAEAQYRRALEIDASQPEAQYNLGYVLLENGRPESSIPFFQGAISVDPRFADAYFNLAMAYEQAGDSRKAAPHWRTYVALEPSGLWTEIALRHL